MRGYLKTCRVADTRTWFVEERVPGISVTNPELGFGPRQGTYEHRLQTSMHGPLESFLTTRSAMILFPLRVVITPDSEGSMSST